MDTVSIFLDKAPPCPSPSNQRSLWSCEGQELMAAIIGGLSPYENWTFLPPENENLEKISNQIEWYVRNWERLSESQIQELICVLTSLELSAAFYILYWIHHHTDPGCHALKQIAVSARIMAQGENAETKRAGDKLWERLAAVTKIVVAQGIVIDSVKQEIMNHE